MSVNALLEEFKVKAATPKQQLAEYKAQGQKVIGVLPTALRKSLYMPLVSFRWVCGAPTLRPSAVQKSTALLSTAPSLS